MSAKLQKKYFVQGISCWEIKDMRADSEDTDEAAGPALLANSTNFNFLGIFNI